MDDIINSGLVARSSFQQGLYQPLLNDFHPSWKAGVPLRNGLVRINSYVSQNSYLEYL
jgi:hypothetical protein